MVTFCKALLLPTVAEEPLLPKTMPKQYTALQKDRRLTSSSSSFDLLKSRKTRRSIACLLQLGPLIQLCMLLIILALVLQSDSQASFAAEQLGKFKEEKLTLLLQLQQIELQSIQLMKISEPN
jgi:hypothetical protein